jgi:uncharacterized membrane protein YeaQ/YmgE (transglycosylase-associated protein family)
MDSDMEILSWLIVGLVTGWLACVVTQTRRSQIVGDLLLGAIGALAGGFLALIVFGSGDPVTGINIVTIPAACLGAIIVIFVVKALGSNQVAAR